MTTQVFRIHRPGEYRKAGPTDLIELIPAPGSTPLFLLKWLIEMLIYGIVQHEFIHLSGPTGSAKSSLLEALYLVPDNFRTVCSSLGFDERPLKLYPIEMATYEAPGELYQRRSLRDGTTYDEMSKLVLALDDACVNKDNCYPLIWLREMGRVHSSSVQGGLMNLMTKNDIILPDGRRINGQGIAWVADSNYQAEHDSNHTLVNLDDALKRRFSINLTLDYLSGEQEVQVVQHLSLEAGLEPVDPDSVMKVVKLGQIIRGQRLDGNLQSLPPPTIYGYLAFLRIVQRLPHLSLPQIAMATLLGNAGLEDRKVASTLCNEVFGLQAAPDDDLAMGGNLF
jgi:hypothetical protein